MTRLAEALAYVLAFEGLVLALLPRRLDDAVRALERIGPEARRLLGLGSMAVGVALLWALGFTTT